MENLIKTIIPPQCLFCKRLGKSFCAKCLSKETLIDIPHCMVCDKPSFDGQTHIYCKTIQTPEDIFSAYIYKDQIRDCIRRSKYQDLMFDALKDLTQASLFYSYRAGIFYQNCIVISVPTSKKRLKQRGFNHIDFISKKIAKFYKVPFVTKAIFRTKNTVPLSELTRTERKELLKGIFVADPSKIKGKNVLLVDDICTTGTTLLACSKTLRGAGALSVRCFTLSRVL